MSGEAALAEAPNDGPLRLFIGVLHARRLNLDQAVPHLRRAADLLPDSPLPKIELARALAGAGRPDEAEAAIAGLSAQGPVGCELAKIRAGVAEAQAAAGRGEASLAAARVQARALPYDPAVRVALARLEDLLGRPEQAEAALREALALDPGCAPALLALADLAERGNRIDELEALLAAGRQKGKRKRRRGKRRPVYAGGGPTPLSTPAVTRPEPVAVPHPPLAGHQRNYAALDLGTNNCRLLVARPSRRGFLVIDAFSRIIRLGEGVLRSGYLSDAAMNRTIAAAVADAGGMARAYRGSIMRTAAMVTAEWYRSWRPEAPA